MNERDIVTIEGGDMLAKYLELRDKGYTSVWAGDGKVCMRGPLLRALETADLGLISGNAVAARPPEITVCAGSPE